MARVGVVVVKGISVSEGEVVGWGAGERAASAPSEMVTGHGIRSTLGQNWEFSEGEATLPLKWRGEVVSLAPASVFGRKKEKQ